jgi:hypothetical protein
LLGRLTRVEQHAAAAGARPRVVSIEWLDPAMLGGTSLASAVRGEEAPIPRTRAQRGNGHSLSHSTSPYCTDPDRTDQKRHST